MKISTAHAVRPCLGYATSGDTTVTRVSDATALFGIIDVLGHGPEAAEVAEIAKAFLEHVSLEQRLAEIIDGLHLALANTRGAAAGLCLVRNGVAEMSVVGNVEIRGLGTRIGVIATPGIVGRRIRKLRSFSFEMQPGDRVVVFSDGLSKVDVRSVQGLGADHACAHLLRDYAVPQDDASVVVADFAHE